MEYKILLLSVSLTNFSWSSTPFVAQQDLSREDSCIRVDLNGVLWKDDGASVRIFEFLRESFPPDTKVIELYYRDLNTGVEEKCLADVEQIGSAAAKLQSNGEEGKRLRNFYQSYLSMVENLTF